jgi:hypothetical protein
MIERTCDGESAFDVIVAHSFSRLFRDAFGLEFYLRKLAKHGVRLVSITQELGEDPAQVMMCPVGATVVHPGRVATKIAENQEDTPVPPMPRWPQLERARRFLTMPLRRSARSPTEMK